MQIDNLKFRFLLSGLVIVTSMVTCTNSNYKKLSLAHAWDTVKVCSNPHKGWYLHYFDNSISNYGNRLAEGEFLKDFPGLNHIYLRLAWSYLEPEEGNFNWALIDTVINKWVAQGYNVSFRITCKETGNQTFATPKWVKDAGAKGTFYDDPRYGYSWEPDYGDPIFLEKLENFHKVFAERYGNKSWLEFVDIGSFGDWGEAHVSKSSKRDWPVEVIKKHIDIHCKYYTNTFILISDDVAGSRYSEDDGTRAEILAYLKEKNVGLRDDSICLKGWDIYGYSTVRNPEYFEGFWPSIPVDLELGHYSGHVKKHGTWKDGRPFEAAIKQTHATFMGFHGYPDIWLSDNLEKTKYLANRAGYWYFIDEVRFPFEIRHNKENKIKITWYNKGVAPAYYDYQLSLLLKSNSSYATHVIYDGESGNRSWMPKEKTSVEYEFKPTSSLNAGKYDLILALYEEKEGHKRFIDLGLSNDLKSVDKHFIIAKGIAVKPMRPM